jgi:hypothetical protein
MTPQMTRRDVLAALVGLEARRHRVRNALPNGRIKVGLAAVVTVFLALVWRATVDSGPQALFSLAKAAAFLTCAGLAISQAQLPLQRGYWEWWLTLPWPRSVLVLGRWLATLRMAARMSAVVGVLTLVAYDLAWATRPAAWLPTAEVLRRALDFVVNVVCLVPALCAMAQLLPVLQNGWRRLLQPAVYLAAYGGGSGALWGSTLWDGVRDWDWPSLWRSWAVETLCSTLLVLSCLALAAAGLHRMGPPGHMGWTMSLSRRRESRGADVRLRSQPVQPTPRRTLFRLFFSRWRTADAGADARWALGLLSVCIVLFVLGAVRPLRVITTMPAGLFLCAVWMGVWLSQQTVTGSISRWLEWLITVPVRRSHLLVIPMLAWWARVALWSLCGEGALCLGAIWQVWHEYGWHAPNAWHPIVSGLEVLGWCALPALLVAPLMSLALSAATLALRGRARLVVVLLWALTMFGGPWMFRGALPGITAGGWPAPTYWWHWAPAAFVLALMVRELLRLADQNLGEAARDPQPRLSRR